MQWARTLSAALRNPVEVQCAPVLSRDRFLTTSASRPKKNHHRFGARASPEPERLERNPMPSSVRAARRTRHA